MMKTLQKFYCYYSAFFVFSLFLNYFDWQLYGYYTEKIVAWIWIFFTLIYIIGFFKNKNVRIYFFTLIGLLILSILPMALPLFGIYYYLTDYGDYQQIKIDDNLRIERTQQQPLSMPRVYIYENYFGLFEKNICRPSYEEIVEKVLGIEDDYDKLNSIDLKETPIQKVKLIAKNSDSIGIEYQILNQKKIIYHPLKNDDGY